MCTYPPCWVFKAQKIVFDNYQQCPESFSPVYTSCEREANVDV